MYFKKMIYLFKRRVIVSARERQRCFTDWFIPQTATIARTRPGQSQEPDTSVSPTQEQEPNDLATFHCFPMCISREMGGKRSGWDLQAQHGLLALQLVA